MEVLEQRAMLSTFTVSNTLDENPGSLRWAIEQSNLDPATDTIVFAIAGDGPLTIRTTSALPAIAHPTIIDGYSQHGAAANTLADGDDAVLRIELSGELSGGADGLVIAADGSAVRGLAINGFNNGILVAADGVVIAGNFIGTDATGGHAKANYQGILVDGSGGRGRGNTIGGTTPADRNVVSGNANQNIFLVDGASHNAVQGNFVGLTASGTATLFTLGNGVILLRAPDNLVGGATPGARNVIAGQAFDGVQIGDLGASGNVVRGNYLGTDPTGTIALGNGNGVAVRYGASGNVIGGAAPGEGNLISGNGEGVLLIDGASGNAVRGNRIGTDASGSAALGNANRGVVVSGSGNVIGGAGPGAGNTIAFNGGVGVVIGSHPGDLVGGNAVLGNAIYGNGGLGIDLGDDGVTADDPGDGDDGPNGLQNTPVLRPAINFEGSLTVSGTLQSAPDTTFTIQFFASPSGDPSGYGEGQRYLGSVTVTTDASGHASFRANLTGSTPDGWVVTATATDPGNDTSEFSKTVAVVTSSTPVYADDDEYGTDVDTTLVVPAPGVLGNDVSIYGGTLTTALVSGTSHGSLTLNPDGSFTYAPQAGYEGLDSFSYRAVDGSESSGPATVTIHVNSNTHAVTNTDDSGPGSLRQAILDSEASNSAATDTIVFAIAGDGPLTIRTTSALPAITHPTIIDGYSQHGAAANTLADGDDAVLRIELSGELSGGADGLVIAADGSAVRGLAINGFNNGILVAADGVVIAGNFIGTDATGGHAKANYQGILVDGSGGRGRGNTIGGTTPADRNVVSGNANQNIFLVDGASHNAVQGNFVGLTASGTATLFTLGNGVILLRAPDNLVGGATPGARNVIAGQAFDGVQIGDLGASGNVVRGNYLGTDPTGTIALGNGNGVAVRYGASGNVIGGAAPGEGNLISGNGEGVLLIDGASGNAVRGNRIGTDASGSAALGNANRGVVVSGSGNVIGGAGPGAGNTIAFNGGVGVVIGSHPGDLVGGNAVLGNAIYGNGGLGIDLGDDGVTADDPGDGDDGPNGLQNAPVLSSAKRTGFGSMIRGELNSVPDTTYTVQFFASPSGDPSGHGEGRRYLGSVTVTTDASGNASFRAKLMRSAPDGWVVTATATDPNGNTSEFAAYTPFGSKTSGSTAPSSLASGLASVRLPSLGETVLDTIALDVIRARRRRIGVR